MEDEIIYISILIVDNESIAHFKVHARLPYITFNNSDEIQITAQNRNYCLLSSKSLLHIQGKLLKGDGTPVTNTRFITNAIYHLFEEARYELHALQIDKNKNVGLKTLIKIMYQFMRFKASFQRMLSCFHQLMQIHH